MRSRKVYPSLDAQSILNENCAKIIEGRKLELLRNTNRLTISLLWEIGTLLNEFAIGHHNNSDVLFEPLRKVLISEFGIPFNLENFQAIRMFAANCSRQCLNEFAATLDWRYVKCLLELKTEEEWGYYVGRTHIEQLSPGALKQRIAVDRQGLTIKIRSAPKFSFLDFMLHPDNRAKLLVENYFANPSLPFYRLLLTPREKPLIAEGKKAAWPIGQEDLLFAILSEVVKFQQQLHSWLNLRFNLLFWDIGKRIEEVFAMMGIPLINQKSYCQSLSEYLEPKFGQLFARKQLGYSVMFAEHYTTDIAAINFATGLHWQHIVLLLPLADMEAKLFYQSIVVKDKLTAISLKRLIKDKTYEKVESKNDHQSVGLDETNATSSITKRSKALSISVTPFNETILGGYINVLNDKDFIGFMNIV